MNLSNVYDDHEQLMLLQESNIHIIITMEREQERVFTGQMWIKLGGSLLYHDMEL